jgi:hypothetical protein
MDLQVEPLPVMVPPPVEECGANQDGFYDFFDLLYRNSHVKWVDVTLSYYETDVVTQNESIPNPAAYNNISDAFNQIIYVLAVNDLTVFHH